MRELRPQWEMRSWSLWRRYVGHTPGKTKFEEKGLKYIWLAKCVERKLKLSQ